MAEASAGKAGITSTSASARVVSGPGAAARNSIGIILVAGMIIGTVFTLFVVPVFYSLLAADHHLKPEAIEGESGSPQPGPFVTEG